MGDAKLIDTMIVDGLWDVYNQYHMGTTAENVAKKYEHLARAAGRVRGREPEQGRGRAEGRQVQGRDRAGDDSAAQGRSGRVRHRRIRQGRHDARLASRGLKPAFAKDGSVTAANASGLNDGGAAVLVMTAARAAQLGLKPLAKIKAFAIVGRRSGDHGHGPGAARRALPREGRLEARRPRPDGDQRGLRGAGLRGQQGNGLGHERRSTSTAARSRSAIRSARRAAACWSRCCTRWRRRDAKKGLASLCIGGGMGVALAVER